MDDPDRDRGPPRARPRRPRVLDTLDDLAELLADVAAVHRWDQRGCGRSDRHGPYTVDRALADLDAVLDHHGLARAALLGHSWGAELALRYSLARPDRVTRLVYVSGIGVDPEATCRPTSPTRPGPASTPSASSPPTWGRTGSAAAPLNADRRRSGGLLGACATLAVPILLVDGALDIRWAVDSLERALPAARRVVLEDAGHLPWVEEPTAFRAAVARFLTSG